MFDTVIHSNSVLTPTGIVNATVIIKNGLIADVVQGKLKNAIDVGDKVLMLGIVDPHVHINEPGRTDWEGFDTATKSAIAGGITTLVDMPLNSSPVTTTVKAFEEKLAACFDKLSMTSKLHSNCGFWGGIIPGNENEIEPLIEKGVLGFKAFLVHSGIDEFPSVTEDDLRKAMPIIAKYKLPLLVHCEVIKNSEVRIQNTESTKSYQAYLNSRPRKWEDDAIALMIKLCEKYNCSVHIVHLSSSNSIEQIKGAKEKGLPLTVETAQHYLYLNAENIPDGQTQFKCAPPIREKENNEKLWQALKEGIIDFVATDHSPAPPAMKELQSGDFMKAWGGIASLQFALPVLWTAARKKNCSIVDIAKWLSENSSKLPGMQNAKGRIQKGFDADFVIWNSEKKFVVTENIIHHKHKVTPYLNEELYGRVEQTYLKGEKVFESGKFLKLNQGQIILH
ncbi:MAG TPA: allantoinase AllB [Chitinophagaceae bacterium]|jgi:allantoinase|nr:allantoinase AllB [Chitinophagaceae bacterium]